MQNINLNMIPGGVMPVINLTQFDEGRDFAIKVMNGSSAADLTGATVTISGRKKDDTAFSYGASDYVKGNPVVSVSGNTVTIRNTQQMAILAGDVLATLTITKSASEVSTLNFTITVQQNPIDGVDVSETEVPGVVALAEEQVDEAEAWAKGTKGGNPVTSDDPQYNNNAKYWSDRAAQYSAGALRYAGSVAFANIPTTGMSNGDLYNITNDFTTDNRFIEGSGIACKAGTDIAWVSSVSKWDLPVVISVPPSVTVDSSMSTTSTNPLQNKVITNALAAGRISFGVDSQGNFGYKKDGADTVYPFKSLKGSRTSINCYGESFWGNTRQFTVQSDYRVNECEFYMTLWYATHGSYSYEYSYLYAMQHIEHPFSANFGQVNYDLKYRSINSISDTTLSKTNYANLGELLPPDNSVGYIAGIMVTENSSSSLYKYTWTVSYAARSSGTVAMYGPIIVFEIPTN